MASSVTFVSVQDGWVLGAPASCATPPCTSVLRTRDGGATWAGIPAPKEPLADSGTGVTEIRFGDPLDGYVFAPHLQATHDGGATWHDVTIPGAPSPQQVFSLAISGGTAYAIAGQNLYRSAITGDAWTQVSGPQPIGFVDTDGISLNGKAVYLESGSPTVNGATVFQHSADGTTWATETLPCPSGYRPLGLAVSTPTDLDVDCDGQLSGNTAQRQLYGSTDGGATFTRLGDPPQTHVFNEMADAGGGHLVLAVTGGAAALQVTVDGAKTWTTVLANLPDNSWTDLGFTDSLHGVAILNQPTGTLYTTADGGKTWGAASY